MVGLEHLATVFCVSLLASRYSSTLLEFPVPVRTVASQACGKNICMSCVASREYRMFANTFYDICY